MNVTIDLNAKFSLQRAETKVENPETLSPANVVEKDEVNKQLQRKVKRIQSVEFEF